MGGPIAAGHQRPAVEKEWLLRAGTAVSGPVPPRPLAFRDGFFLACEDLGRMFDHSFPACVFFFLFFFFEVVISSRTLILLLIPGSVHSGSAS